MRNMTAVLYLLVTVVYFHIFCIRFKNAESTLNQCSSEILWEKTINVYDTRDVYTSGGVRRYYFHEFDYCIYY